MPRISHNLRALGSIEGALEEFENQIRVQPSIRFAPVISVRGTSHDFLPRTVLSEVDAAILIESSVPSTQFSVRKIIQLSVKNLVATET